MNKTAIKNFSIWARNKLIADISYQAGLMGITETGIAKPLPQSTAAAEFYNIGTAEPYSISGEAVRQRRALVAAIERKAKESNYETAYKYVLEEVAYTWFNRLIAVRFMEVNDYLPSHIRVLSSDSGKTEPDLVTTPFDAELSFTDAEQSRIYQLKMDNAVDELFRLLFIRQCNALNAILPGLFEKTNDFTELLLNVSVIDKEGVVYHLVRDIPEEDFDVNRGGQVEIIGWLYQYYNTEPKNEAFAKNGKITKDEIPAVTQLFTPDWIVRYMVENSLGRLWLEGHPNDALRQNWKYYLDEAPQEPEVAAQLAELRKEHAKLNPQDIKVLDPCMGSGHILVYAFDVLMQIYESAGWTQRDAAKSILEHNLYGLDIDDRAYQLAYFAVMMKARQYDRRIFSRGVQPQLYSPSGYADGEEFGSLMQVDELEPEPMGQLDMFGGDLNTWNFRRLLSQKYDVVVTNPPYMGGGSMSGKLSEFVKKYYPDSKADLFAVFIERCGQLTKKNGYQAMITMHSWMFLSSFEKLRMKLQAVDTVNMAHLGPRAFDEISGEVVQTTSFVLHIVHIPDYLGTYCRLIEPASEAGKAKMFLSGAKRYNSASSNFSHIPGSPIAYWVSGNIIKAFVSARPFLSYAKACSGLKTGDNDRFLRTWFEVRYSDICLSATNTQTAVISSKKWFPYNKGGTFRRWYGNRELLVNFENDGAEIRSLKEQGVSIRITSYENYFKAGVTWNGLTTGYNSFRYCPSGSVFDSNKGPMFFCDDEDMLFYFLGLFNTKVAFIILQLLNPSLSLQNGDMEIFPIYVDYQNTVDSIVLDCISVSQNDWDSFETSWDFQRHPLLRGVSTIAEAYAQWETECETRFQTLKANEEELNRIFIDIYGLQDELTPEVEDRDVTVRRADLTRDIKSLLSYAVGCMFGRYSLDQPGLILAGQKFGDKFSYATAPVAGMGFAGMAPLFAVKGDCYLIRGEEDLVRCSFSPDADNIIPITDEEYLEDDIVARLCDWLKAAYGAETLEENLDYIAAALGGRGNSSREIIRNYFLTGFFDDHCQTYSVTGSGKRPIYWLFDSGKQNGFKALIYLHRYNADTIGNLRVDYLHRMQRVYESEIDRMQDTIDHSGNAREVATASKRKEKLQKQLKECRDYDEKISHLALSRIELDLDDGVKVNYRKLQTANDGKFYEVLANSKNIMAKEK